MDKELIYIWVNKDRNGCFNQMGFNFSPKFFVAYNQVHRIIKIEKTEKINVFEKNNIVNVTALIGENGTGKTTLLKYLTNLSDTPITDGEGDYVEWKEHENKFDKFIAVYYDSTKSNFTIVNRTDFTILKNDGSAIAPYSGEDFRNEDFIGQVSHLYFSNGEYTENLNMRSLGKVDYLTLTNNALSSMSMEFFKRQYCVSEKIIDSKFNAFQTNFLYQSTIQQFQSILDVHFYNKTQCSANKFFGKIISKVDLSVVTILSMIKQEGLKLNYDSKYSSEEVVEAFRKQFAFELQKIKVNERIETTIILNLLGELIFAYGYQLNGFDLDINEVYIQCKNYITQIDIESEKSYYNSAIEDINGFLKLLTESEWYNNLIPVGDLARQSYHRAALEELWAMIEKNVKNGRSFILKYLRIINLEMSSGERAILNFLSRLYFASKINDFIPESGFVLQHSVLMLIDEIDVYLHPEWQRQLLKDLLDELNNLFPENKFQIIFTSHSPIVLSDVPTENSIFLKRSEDGVIQVERNIQTFGANIYTLYKDAFFISDGLGMGSFAKSYISQLIKDIQKRQIFVEDAKKKINVIGEPVLRKKISQMLDENFIMDEVATKNERQQMLMFLKKQKNEIEHQIALLEGKS